LIQQASCPAPETMSMWLNSPAAPPPAAPLHQPGDRRSPGRNAHLLDRAAQPQSFADPHGAARITSPFIASSLACSGDRIVDREHHLPGITLREFGKTSTCPTAPTAFGWWLIAIWWTAR
jgi:hypothetical protein